MAPFQSPAANPSAVVTTGDAAPPSLVDARTPRGLTPLAPSRETMNGITIDFGSLDRARLRDSHGITVSPNPDGRSLTLALNGKPIGTIDAATERVTFGVRRGEVVIETQNRPESGVTRTDIHTIAADGRLRAGAVPADATPLATPARLPAAAPSAAGSGFEPVRPSIRVERQNDIVVGYGPLDRASLQTRFGIAVRANPDGATLTVTYGGTPVGTVRETTESIGFDVRRGSLVMTVRNRAEGGVTTTSDFTLTADGTFRAGSPAPGPATVRPPSQTDVNATFYGAFDAAAATLPAGYSLTTSPSGIVARGLTRPDVNAIERQSIYLTRPDGTTLNLGTVGLQAVHLGSLRPRDDVRRDILGLISRGLDRE